MRLYYIGEFDTVTSTDGISRPVLPWDGLSNVPAKWLALGDGAGGYSKQWVFAVVGGDQHDTIQQNSKAWVFPDAGLDTTFGSFNNNVRRQITDKLDALGIQTSGINSQTTVREILELIGKTLNPNFSAIGFDVADTF